MIISSRRPATPGLALACIVLAFSFATASSVAAQSTPKTDDEKAFYSIGTGMAGQFQSLKPISDRELDLLMQGFRDALAGKTLAVEQQEGARVVQAMVSKRQAKALALEKTASAEFVAAETKKSGAKATESGLIYREIKAGNGASPNPADRVRVHYHGTLRDGSVFDSSVDRGQPAEFPLNQVIPCWTEGVAMMKVGGKSQLVCPATIAYGERGRPGIPGGAALSFEVELLEILE